MAGILCGPRRTMRELFEALLCPKRSCICSGMHLQCFPSVSCACRLGSCKRKGDNSEPCSGDGERRGGEKNPDEMNKAKKNALAANRWQWGISGVPPTPGAATPAGTRRYLRRHLEHQTCWRRPPGTGGKGGIPCTLHPDGRRERRTVLPTVPPLRALTHLAGLLGVREPWHQTPQNCCAPVQRAPSGPGRGRDASGMVRDS